METPNYIPEQETGAMVDPSSELYARAAEHAEALGDLIDNDHTPTPEEMEYLLALAREGSSLRKNAIDEGAIIPRAPKTPAFKIGTSGEQVLSSEAADMTDAGPYKNGRRG